MKAKQHILISSLYIGTGKLEVKLISALVKQLRAKPQLKVDIFLDLNRSNRKNKEPGEGGCFNTMDVLSPLNEFENRVSVILTNADQNLLYETHEKILSKIAPYQLQELRSVHHIKAYIFDDNVLISGANLSHEYFTSRCDRYILIKKASLMVNDMVEFFSLLKRFGFSSSKPTEKHKKYEMVLKNIAEQKFAQRNKDNKQVLAGILLKASNFDTILSLYFSLPKFGMPVERDLMSFIYTLADTYPDIPYEYATMTAYFNMDMELFNVSSIKKNERYTFVTSERSNNSFRNSTFPKSLVPYVMLYNIHEALKRANELNINIFEYNQPNHTFHGKGLWLIPLLSGHYKLYYPSLYVFGSSNYGYRSLYRDSEIGVVLSTDDMHLKNKLNRQLSMFMDKSLVSTIENVRTRLGWWASISKFSKYFFKPFL